MNITNEMVEAKAREWCNKFGTYRMTSDNILIRSIAKDHLTETLSLREQLEKVTRERDEALTVINELPGDITPASRIHQAEIQSLKKQLTLAKKE
jgi:hypothetical protein